MPWDSQWQAHRNDGLLDFMAHLAVFFNHQLLFDVSGKWPVPARGHGRHGYREFLVEKLGISPQEFSSFVPLLVDGARVVYLPCPCGSAKQAKRCHLIVVHELISKIGRANYESKSHGSSRSRVPRLRWLQAAPLLRLSEFREEVPKGRLPFPSGS